jgi:Spy/CpxP family protein refolding chaperone
LAAGEYLSGEMMEESENPMKITMFRSSVLRVAVLAIGATALSALPAMAQDPSAPPPPPQDQAGSRHGGMGSGGMRGNQVEFLTKKLSLTPDQVTQVKAIDADAMNQMKALHEDTSVAGPDKRAKMMDIHKTSQDKIRGLLTDDQKTKFDALQAQMRERRGDHGGGGDGPPPPPPQQ